MTPPLTADQVRALVAKIGITIQPPLNVEPKVFKRRMSRRTRQISEARVKATGSPITQTDIDDATNCQG